MIKPRKIEQWSVVTVLWEDAYEQYGQGLKSSDFTVHKPVMRKTTGHLLYWDEKSIRIAGCDDRAKSETCACFQAEDCADVFVIPHKMIEKVTVLSETN